MSLTAQQFKQLRDLRKLFLQRSHLASDYWRSFDLLDIYDLTLGARISWKWGAVLAEIANRGPLQNLMSPHVVDWGCGSGRAIRTYLKAMSSTKLPNAVTVWDRSNIARSYARQKIKDEFASVDVSMSSAATDIPLVDGGYTLLLSHVANELDPKGRGVLRKWLKLARVIVWVEPGDHHCSALLREWRKQLLRDFKILAPCWSDATCPLANKEFAKDWCHQFAEAPAEIFQSADWQRIADELSIDLRSVPYSYLVLVRKTDGIELQLQEGCYRQTWIGHEHGAKSLICNEKSKISRPS